MPMRTEWLSPAQFPPVPFLHKKSVRESFFLGAFIFATSVTSRNLNRKIHPLELTSLILVTVVCAVGLALSLLFPSKREHSSLARMRLDAGRTIDAENLGAREIRRRFPEHLRLGAIHNADLNLIMRKDFANFELTLEQLQERHDYQSIPLEMDNHINSKLRSAESLPEFISDQVCNKYAGTQDEIRAKLVAVKMKVLEGVDYSFKSFLANFGHKSLPCVRSSTIMQDKLAASVNADTFGLGTPGIWGDGSLRCLAAEHIHTHMGDYLYNPKNRLIEDSKLPQDLLDVLTQDRKLYKDLIESRAVLSLKMSAEKTHLNDLGGMREKFSLSRLTTLACLESLQIDDTVEEKDQEALAQQVMIVQEEIAAIEKEINYPIYSTALKKKHDLKLQNDLQRQMQLLQKHQAQNPSSSVQIRPSASALSTEDIQRQLNSRIEQITALESNTVSPQMKALGKQLEQKLGESAYCQFLIAKAKNDLAENMIHTHEIQIKNQVEELKLALENNEKQLSELRSSAIVRFKAIQEEFIRLYDKELI